jgi:hypothetical protein
LEGPHYEIDCSDVWTKLKAWTLETAGWEWIRDFDVSKDGRGAWKALNEHYNGSGHVSCRGEYAKAKLEKLRWLNEAVFLYDKYSTAMKQCFIDLGDPQNTDESYLQRQQVDKLIKGMKNTHAAVESAKLICLDKHSVDFDQAVNDMSGQVARIFPKSYESSTKQKRQISGVDTEGHGRGRGSGRGGRGCGRGRYGGREGSRGGRSGRSGSGGGTTMMNGVDVANVTRSFSEDNWHKLGDAGRQYVNAERARNRGSGNNDNCNVSDVNTGGAGNDADNAGDDTVTGSTNLH